VHDKDYIYHQKLVGKYLLLHLTSNVTNSLLNPQKGLKLLKFLLSCY